MDRPRSVATWLRAAERAGLLRVTPRAIVAVERLLRTRARWEPDELASRLASLLAEDGESWRRIHRHCLDTLEFRTPPVGVVIDRWFRRVPGWVWAALLALVIATAAVVGPRVLTALRHGITQALTRIHEAHGEPSTPGPWSLTALHDRIGEEVSRGLRLLGERLEPTPTKFAPPRPSVRVEQVEPERLVALEPRVEHVYPPEDERLSSGWLALWIAISAALAGLAARGWWFGVADYQRVVEQAAADSEAQKDAALGAVEQVRSIYFIPPSLPLPRGDIDEAATILARMSSGEPGRELDVPPTMRRTLDAGGRFSPVYARSPAGETLLVLVDIETHEGHAYLDGVEQLLAAWERGGLRFERHDFKGSPEKLTAGKQNFTLEQLIERHEEAPVLLFSRLLEAQDYDLDRTWMLRLRAWSRRAWLDLDPRGLDAPGRRGLLEEAESAGLVRFPFTREGLLACARGLAQGELRGASVRETELPAADDAQREALELWAACAACVPDPTWPQLEAVRQRIPALADLLPDPRLLGRLLGHLHGRGWLEPEAERGQGERLLLTGPGVEELLARLRRHDAGRPKEQQLDPMTRRLLIEQLLAADVEGDPYSAARKLLKLRYQQALLDEKEVEPLLELAEGPVADELRRMLAVECRLQARESGQRWSRATLSRAAALAGAAPRASFPGLAPSAWSRGQVGVFLGGAGLVLASWGALGILGGLAPPQARVTEALVLRDPERSRVTLDPPLRPDLVAIRGGKFMMGSSVEEQDRARAEFVAKGLDAESFIDLYRDEVRHEAEIGDFELCKTEVTQGQWKRVMGVTALQTKECGNEVCDDEKPITDVTWFEAVEFVNRLTEKENERQMSGEKLTLCYAGVSEKDVRWERNCTGYRLPTEAEWEYAARAGSQTAYFFGDDPKKLCEHANVADLTAKAKYPDWFIVECDDRAADLATVGSYRPNKLDLYDVQGNVWEWAWDWFGDYKQDAPKNYVGPENGVLRVVRGGSFRDVPRGLRSALRNGNVPTDTVRVIGLRCARGPHLSP